jgi:hypothetical protein
MLYALRIIKVCSMRWLTKFVKWAAHSVNASYYIYIYNGRACKVFLPIERVNCIIKTKAKNCRRRLTSFNFS